MSGPSGGRAPIAMWSAVVIAAFVCAWLLVRAMSASDVAVRAANDGGELRPFGEGPNKPPPTALGGELGSASRCKAVGASATLISEPNPAIGEAIIEPSGLVAIGLAHDADGGRWASLATFRPADPNANTVLLGPAGGDDPPPKAFVFEGALHAARVETSRDKRRLVVTSVARIEGDGALRPAPSERASFEQTRDESLSFDVASDTLAATVVWDDDDAGRGVIRHARLGGAAAVVSPKTSDAEAPRVVADGRGGAFIAWIARQVEGDAGGYAIERGAEGPESRWVEVVHVSPSAITEAVRLAPPRVSGFDLALDGDALSVFARDEDGDITARGARLIHQKVRRDGAGLKADAPTILVREGVGALEPLFVDDGAGGLVSYGDLVERTRLIVITSAAPTGVDAGAPSLETLLEGGRIVGARPAASVAKAPVWGLTTASKAGSLAVFASSKPGRSEARILLCER